MSDEYLGKLKPSLRKILEDHNCSMYHLKRYFSEKGFAPYCFFDDIVSAMHKTSVNIIIRHDNDYIEMGSANSDPKGEMFHVYTEGEVEFRVHPANLEALVGFLQSFSEHKDTPKSFNHIKLDFFPWYRGLKPSLSAGVELTLKVKFKVYHTYY